MPVPKKLKVGDRVRFVCLPEEWGDPGCSVLPESVEFMETMVSRSWPSRVFEIDEFGTPWIDARIRKKGRLVHHTWGIFEKSGWRLVGRGT